MSSPRSSIDSQGSLSPRHFAAPVEAGQKPAFTYKPISFSAALVISESPTVGRLWWKKPEMQDQIDKTVQKLAKVQLNIDADGKKNELLRKEVFGSDPDEENIREGSFSQGISSFWNRWVEKFADTVWEAEFADIDNPRALHDLQEEGMFLNLLEYPLDSLFKQLYKIYMSSIKENGHYDDFNVFKRMRLIYELRKTIEEKFLSTIVPFVAKKIATAPKEQTDRYILWAGNQLSRLNRAAGQNFFTALLGKMEVAEDDHGGKIFTLPREMRSENGKANLNHFTRLMGLKRGGDDLISYFTEEGARGRFAAKLEEERRREYDPVALDRELGKVAASAACAAILLQKMDGALLPEHPDAEQRRTRVDLHSDQMTKVQLNALPVPIRDVLIRQCTPQSRKVGEKRQEAVQEMREKREELNRLLQYAAPAADPARDPALALLTGDENPFHDVHTVLSEFVSAKQIEYAELNELPVYRKFEADKNALGQYLFKNHYVATVDAANQMADEILALLTSDGGSLDAVLNRHVHDGDHKDAIKGYVERSLNVTVDEDLVSFGRLLGIRAEKKRLQGQFLRELRGNFGPNHQAFADLRTLSDALENFDQFTADFRKGDSAVNQAILQTRCGFELPDAFINALDDLERLRMTAFKQWRGALEQRQEENNALQAQGDEAIRERVDGVFRKFEESARMINPPVAVRRDPYYEYDSYEPIP